MTATRFAVGDGPLFDPDSEALQRPGGEAPREAPGGAGARAPADPDEPAGDAPLGEMQLEVQPGQTVSGLAHLYYGEHGAALLQALAEYNGLDDPDSLRAGAHLRLPARETLRALER